MLCRALEAPLHNHGGAETDLAYIALDHILHQKSRLKRLYHDHREVDVLLKQVEEIKDLPKARTQMKAVLDACRAHFRVEEQIVFPLIEKALQRETLIVLEECGDRSRICSNSRERQDLIGEEQLNKSEDAGER